MDIDKGGGTMEDIGKLTVGFLLYIVLFYGMARILWYLFRRVRIVQKIRRYFAWRRASDKQEK